MIKTNTIHLRNNGRPCVINSQDQFCFYTDIYLPWWECFRKMCKVKGRGDQTEEGVSQSDRVSQSVSQSVIHSTVDEKHLYPFYSHSCYYHCTCSRFRNRLDDFCFVVIHTRTSFHVTMNVLKFENPSIFHPKREREKGSKNVYSSTCVGKSIQVCCNV